MKVLISAYACEPDQGSEPGVGWDFVNAMSKHHQLWVLTQSDGRAAIEEAIAQKPNSNLNFVYFDPFSWQLDLWEAKAEIQLHYYLWQIQAYFVGRSLHKTLQFDLTHHVTFVKYWGPSFLSLLPVPFLWGPVGGGESAPKAFWHEFSWRGKIYETLRETARWVGEQDPFTRLTARRSTLSQATTADTADRLRCIGADPIQIDSQVGLSAAEISRLGACAPPTSEKIRFVSVGRLLHWKGFHLSLRAFLQADLPEADYWLLGDGPERSRLEAIAQNSSATDRVKFFGSIPRSEVLERLSQCHVMVHPSLHDSGGWACVEAMAAGRPVICLDLGGPAVQVTAETGIKVVANTPEQAVRDISIAMQRLSAERSLLVQMGQKAQQRVQDVFNWESKACQTAQIYEKICANQSRAISE